MKRFLAVFIFLSVGLSLCGCFAELPAGYNEFTNARKAYEKLDSAEVFMTNLDTGEKIMEFSFYFTPKDEMVFSYYGCMDGEEQRAYSDGAEFFYKESNDKKWNVISSGDDSYIYNIYNRKYRYPYAEGRIFFLAAEAVEQADISQNGGTEITYIYNPEKLNNMQMPGISQDISRFSALATVMKIGSDGIVQSFTERGTVTTAGGEELTLNMEISVQNPNNVSEIICPVDEVYKKGENTSQ